LEILVKGATGDSLLALLQTHIHNLFGCFCAAIGRTLHSVSNTTSLVELEFGDTPFLITPLFLFPSLVAGWWIRCFMNE